MRIPFWKYESVGNDFPILSLAELPPSPDLNRLAIKMCDRRFGIGGDGLLTLEQVEADRLNLRMFNPDGTEDFCGNGIRCAARYASDLGWVGESFEIRHLGRTVPVRIQGDLIVTEIGKASYRPADVPLRPGFKELFQTPIYWSETETIQGSALTTGSTHVILPVESLPSTEELERLGPLIEHFELYPARTSVIWTKVVSRNHLKIRIWERGVGETLGCGTGSSAAAMDYLRAERRGGEVKVDNPGGSVRVSAAAWEAAITIFGEAQAVFSGRFLDHS
jgi:diaminopimelate epimerase